MWWQSGIPYLAIPWCAMPARRPPAKDATEAVDLILIRDPWLRGHPWQMKTGSRSEPWAVQCSAEGASAASTVSVTCEFAVGAGRFQPRHIQGMHSSWSGEDDQLVGGVDVTVVSAGDRDRPLDVSREWLEPRQQRKGTPLSPALSFPLVRGWVRWEFRMRSW